MNEGRYHELLGRLLDDELDSTQGRELADWLPRNPDLRSDVKHHLQLWDLFSQQCRRERTADTFVESCKTRIAAGADENIFVRETEHKLREATGKTARTEGKPALSFIDWLRRFIPSPRWVVGFAAVLLIGLSAWLFPLVNSEPTLTVAMGTRVTVERGGQSFPAENGLKLLPGDLLKTTTNCATLITYGRENTRIVVTSDTELKFLNWREGKRFELQAGEIVATVARQRWFRPMVFMTPQAEARVLGTKFTLTATTNATRLDVTEGKVKLTRTSDGAPVKVGAGYYAIAADAAELVALPFTGRISLEYWTGMSGDAVGALKTDTRYPDKPSRRDFLNSFEEPTNWSGGYGTRIRGYLYPPKTGQYRFWIAADDSAELYLSLDDSPDQKDLIASLYFRCKPREWTKYPWQQSSPIKLKAGHGYYIEVLHSKNAGAGHLAVAWQIPGGKQEIIPGAYLAPFKIDR